LPRGYRTDFQLGGRQLGAFSLTVLLILCVLVVAKEAESNPGQIEQELGNLAACGGILVEHSNGEVLLSVFPDIPRVPASVLKLATASFVLKTLGSEARLQTLFAYDESRRTLAVIGGGDPYLVSDELRCIADSLKALGIKDVALLTADCSAFRTPIVVDGQGDSSNPFDAGISAFAVNFNTVVVHVSADGTIGQGEPETPLTPGAAAIGRRFGRPGIHRLPIPDEEQEGPYYALELLAALLREKDIHVGESKRLLVSDGSMPVVYIHRNRRTVAEMVELMLEYSNNFAANMLLLAAARHIEGKPVDLEEAATLLTDFVRHEIGGSQTVALEGSGLSRRNRMSPRDVVRTLQYLSDNGWSGILPDYNGVIAKSGTLMGISSLGGYLNSPKGGEARFALLLEGAQDLRDKVLSVLTGNLTALVDQSLQKN
jgi:D-alanyl-D-alanine carboxypeptidase/D-alanyl-D-alanine-endopeptidase (penicillin-binding protein 4)